MIYLSNNTLLYASGIKIIIYSIKPDTTGKGTKQRRTNMVIYSHCTIHDTVMTINFSQHEQCYGFTRVISQVRRHYIPDT